MLLRISELRENRGRKGRPFETTVNEIALRLYRKTIDIFKAKIAVSLQPTPRSSPFALSFLAPGTPDQLQDPPSLLLLTGVFFPRTIAAEA